MSLIMQKGNAARELDEYYKRLLDERTAAATAYDTFIAEVPCADGPDGRSFLCVFTYHADRLTAIELRKRYQQAWVAVWEFETEQTI